MAKISPICLISGMSGKLGKRSEYFFVTNRQTGRIHTAKRTESYHVPSEAQVAAQAKFTQRVQNTCLWIKTNGPATEHPMGTEAYQKALAAYKAQRKIGSFFGYVASKLVEE